VYEFLSQNSLYIVLIVSLAVWAGICIFLFRLERKVRRIEKELVK